MAGTVSRIGICFSAVCTLALSGNALGFAVAGAEPNDLYWDIEAYDACMKKTVRDANQCCTDSGGYPTDEPLDNEKGQKCAAPPGEAQGAGGLIAPPGKLPPGIVAPIGPPQVAGDPAVPPPRPLPQAPVVTLAPIG
ncbi:hypothetical protein ABGB19_00710 [Mycobacterium sp. B14F4]|uniref:hypothetical protein n=1 Tax=Mycobacterium sp. B14F4 TaxID=3153565 RepID=UPI00325EFF1E